LKATAAFSCPAETELSQLLGWQFEYLSTNPTLG
jgi:hypothetical protein